MGYFRALGGYNPTIQTFCIRKRIGMGILGFSLLASIFFVAMVECAHTVWILRFTSSPLHAFLHWRGIVVHMA
jgi:hypothetical protein